MAREYNDRARTETISETSQRERESADLSVGPIKSRNEYAGAYSI